MKPSDITDALDDARDCLKAAEDRMRRMKAERDAYLAYAAMLQAEATLTSDFKEWTPEAAIEHVQKNAVIDVKQAGEAGWSARDITSLMNCRDAVRERG